MDFRNRETSHDTSHNSALGICFQISPDQQVFIPYAWLLKIELNTMGSLVFSFSHAKITVLGSDLDSIYEAAITARLSRIRIRATAPGVGKDWVQQIVIENNGSPEPSRDEFRL